MGLEEEGAEASELVLDRTQILRHEDSGSGDGFQPKVGRKTDSDATTVDEQGHGDASLHDSASSYLHLQGEPTLILGGETELIAGDTQILELPESSASEPRPEATRNIATVRAQSLRSSAMAAYEKLMVKLESQPRGETLDDSAKFVLQWGEKQQQYPALQRAQKAESLVEENLFLGEASCSAALATTPQRTQPASQQMVLAMCSNNKKSTGLNKPPGSPSLKPECTLDRVRKVLFEGTNDALQPMELVVGVVQGGEAAKSRAGELSYLNSQEPGEESQAIALEALDKLVSLNCADMSQDAKVDEFTVELKKTPNFLSGLAQLQKKESGSVFDFVNSQGASEPVVENLQQADKNVSEKPVEEDEPKKEAVVKPNRVTRSSRASTGPRSAKRQAEAEAEASPEQTPRGKRCKKTAAQHMEIVSAAASPVTPKSPATGEGSGKSTGRKRKTRTPAEKLKPVPMLALETPRRCRRKPVKILFSHSLGKEAMDEHAKVLKKLNFEVVSQASDCTHFVTGSFSRSANMLEVLAAGKPVVSMAWLESCKIAGCAVDEKKFILEDSRKEKELGFSMQTTFSLAQQKLLLEGMSVFITPKTKPECVGSVVRAAGGKVVGEFTGDRCIVISCEEDHHICLPLLKKGIKIYSTEFLFSSIVSYHLDLSRHLLFAEN